MIVFSFLHQPTDAICLVPLLQKLGKRPIECGLPPLDHAAILLHGIRCFADRQSLGKAFSEEVGVVLEHPDNEDGLSVVSRVKPGKYPFEIHKKALLPLIFLQYSTDFGGEKERRGDEEN